MTDLLDEISELKRREDATILAHYYQEGDIQELADFTGDSLKLARAATKVNTSTIVFCGVHFMAETAKILNPSKRVLLPDLKAGCSLAESCPAPQLERFQNKLRAEGGRFQTVTYINSTAAVKALSDWVVTSGNAEAIIRRLPALRILAVSAMKWTPQKTMVRLCTCVAARASLRLSPVKSANAWISPSW